MSVYHLSTIGRFNLLSDERQQQIALYTPYGVVSEIWPEGDIDYSDEMSPDEVICLIEHRLSSYLFSSRRVDEMKKIAEIRSHMAEVNCLWAREMAIRFQANAARAAKQAMRFCDMASEYAEEAGGAQ